MIIDDEPASRDILQRYIRDTPVLSLQCTCRDAFEASEKLSQHPVDLLFLDINMPRLSGISFARSLSRKPLIVFTTAYPEYAVEGFELEAVDYLVKPFSFERFLKAVNRAADREEQGARPEPAILIRSDKKIYSLRLSTLSHIEGCGDYIKLHLDDGKMLVVHDTIKRFLGDLPPETFMRIHRSWIINVERVEYLEGNMVHLGKNAIPVSPATRQVLLDLLESHR
jgi:DNA-binding LytR/AlgR family response regulator